MYNSGNVVAVTYRTSLHFLHMSNLPHSIKQHHITFSPFSHTCSSSGPHTSVVMGTITERTLLIFSSPFTEPSLRAHSQKYIYVSEHVCISVCISMLLPCHLLEVSLSLHHSLNIFNLRRVGAARVTVVGFCVCVRLPHFLLIFRCYARCSRDRCWLPKPAD